MTTNESGNHLVTDQDRTEVHAAEVSRDEADERRRRGEAALKLRNILFNICLKRSGEQFISALEKAGILISYKGEEFGRMD